MIGMNSAALRWRPSDGEGTTESQFPAFGRPREAIRAISRKGILHLVPVKNITFKSSYKSFNDIINNIID